MKHLSTASGVGKSVRGCVCYIVSVLRDVVSALGDFCAAGHLFGIKRDLPLSLELQRLVFPEVDDLLRRQR